MKRLSRVRRRARRLIWILLGTVAAVVLFQVVIMPIFVKHGDDVAVPDLRGLSAADVGPRLEEASLTAGLVIEAVDDHVPAGRIVRQSPQPGASVRRGRQVDLVVSAGPMTEHMPELTGETLFHARFILQREGIQIGKISRVTHGLLPADCIVAASPPAGTPVGRRATAELLVSSGRPAQRFLMPDLSGFDAEAARQTLEASGLRVVQRTRPSSGGRPGEIVEQTPPPGYPIDAGGTVEIHTSG